MIFEIVLIVLIFIACVLVFDLIFNNYKELAEKRISDAHLKSIHRNMARSKRRTKK